MKQLKSLLKMLPEEAPADAPEEDTAPADSLQEMAPPEDEEDDAR